MPGKLIRIWHSLHFCIGLAVLAALTFNNWVLGPMLNKTLFDKNGSVSEFSALNQPYYWVFRSLDILSGLLMIILAIALKQFIDGRAKTGRVLIGGLFLLGVSNAIDALLPLSCSETLSSACKVPVSISLSHFQVPPHAYSSVLIAICYLVLPIAGLLYALGRKINLLIIISTVSILIALYSLLSAILQYESQNSLSVRTSGLGQEVQMAFLGLWLISLALAAYSGKSASEPSKTRGHERLGAKPAS